MTQIAGRDCSVCGQQILLSREGTFCVKCRAALHRACLDPEGVRCAACGTAWVEPDALYVRSERCPACGNRKIDEQQDHCRSCGTAVYWETEKDLADEKRRIHSVGIRRLFLAGTGLAMVVLLTLCLPDVWEAPWVGFLLAPLLTGLSVALGVLSLRLVPKGLQYLSFK